MTVDLPTIDGFAGIAALVNSLIMWPVVKSLKETVQFLKDDHETRLRALEEARLAKAAKQTKKPRRRGTI